MSRVCSRELPSLCEKSAVPTPSGVHIIKVPEGTESSTAASLTWSLIPPDCQASWITGAANSFQILAHPYLPAALLALPRRWFAYLPKALQSRCARQGSVKCWCPPRLGGFRRPRGRRLSSTTRPSRKPTSATTTPPTASARQPDPPGLARILLQLDREQRPGSSGSCAYADGDPSAPGRAYLLGGRLRSLCLSLPLRLSAVEMIRTRRRQDETTQKPGVYRFTNHQPSLGEVQLGAGVWDAHRGAIVAADVWRDDPGVVPVGHAHPAPAGRVDTRHGGRSGDQLPPHRPRRVRGVLPAQPDLSAPLWPLGCVDPDPARGLQILAERGHASFHERPRAHFEIHHHLVGPTTQEIVATEPRGRVGSRLVLVPGTAQDAELLAFSLPPIIPMGCADDWTAGLAVLPLKDWSGCPPSPDRSTPATPTNAPVSKPRRWQPFSAGAALGEVARTPSSHRPVRILGTVEGADKCPPTGRDWRGSGS